MYRASELAGSGNLNSAAEELRRKVLIARIIAVVGLLSIVGIVILFQWLGSDSGTVAKAEFSLKNDHSQRNIIECLDTAERLAKAGKKQPAEQIEAAVDSALSGGSTDATSIAKADLELAKALQKQGNEEFAFKYAIESLKKTRESIAGSSNQVVVAKSDKSKSKISLTDLSGQIDEAADIALHSKRLLSKEQLESILPLLDAFIPVAEKEGSDRILDLTVNSFAKEVVPLSDSVLRCMFAKDRILARRGQMAELEKSANRSIDASNKLQSDTVLRKWPDPCLLRHLVDLARLVRGRDSNVASRYLEMAEEIIAKMDRSQQNDEQQLVTAECREKMSEAYVGIGDKGKGLQCAREAASIRPLQDANSAICMNQLINALLSAGQYKEAEPLASELYKFCKSKDAKDLQLQNLRGACVVSYFDTLIGLKKNSQAVSLINDEIKDQRKRVPSSVLTVVALNTKLADYYLKRSELKYATTCARQLAECTKYLHGQEKVQNDMVVIKYAAATKTPELSAEACSDALANMAKINRTPMDQEWIDGLCLALDNLKKADASELYQQVLESLKNGFVQQLSAKSADAVALAKVVNELGTSGEAKTADSLRTEAIEKLPEAKSIVFRSHSMDFVVEGEKDSAQYAEPQSAAKVYLDLAHSMLNKDNDSASKNAFEALKIYHVLAKKNPDLRERLLDSIEDASNVLALCKMAPTSAQRKVCFELSTLEEEFIKKTGKGRILDLAFSAQSKDEPLSEETVGLILLRGEALARRGQVAQLDTHIKQTREAVIEFQQTGGFTYANHLTDLADLLAQHQQQLPARRYLSMAKKILEEIPTKEPEPAITAAGSAVPPGQLKSGGNTSTEKPGGGSSKTLTEAANQSAKPSDPGGEPAKPSFPIPELGKQCSLWDKLALLYSKVGDRQSAVACARRSVSLRPPRDAASGNSALILVDGLVNLRNYTEAEPVALELYRFTKAQGASTAYAGLRCGCVRRLFQIMKGQNKDAAAVAIVREELDTRKRSSSAQPFQTVQLYSDLANYYVSRGDSASLAECIGGIRHCKSLLTPEEKLQWERSGMQKDLIAMALRSNEPRVVAEEIADLVTYKNIDKGVALRTPAKWWSIGLTTYKTGDPKIYKQVLDFVREGYSQQLAKSDADASFLADMLTDLGTMGEVTLAVQMRDEAKKRLPAAKAEILLARVKGLPSEVEAPKENPPAEEAKTAEKPGTTQPGVPVTKTEHRPEGGRLDASDD